ncbi:MAG: MBOAT family protein [Planctomycetes bacterium]|nr:MBOAT family protein [Planctomycetota bacterium]
MLFNSYTFWAFFAVVVVLYRLMRHKWQNRMLLIASYVFYGSWNWRFLSLILISTIVDYFAAIGIARSKSARGRKLLCLISICTNLGLLGVFKYYGFFANEAVAWLNAAGLHVTAPSLAIVLPVGISFYTFQTMSYTIDVYRGVTRPIRNLPDFALYVCFFPQLVAGPIERSSRLLPQIVKPRPNRPGDFKEGLYLVLMGLFRKIVIADNMAFIVNGIFAADISTLSGVDCLAGVYAFAFQIYADFSGYSSIARGVAKWLGFDLMTNFRMPYLARTPSEFWRRWHISLSTWLRDYLYIPLGGNRGRAWKTCRNLMLTMLLGGLWHGAGWTFIVWGLFHGLILCVYRPFEKQTRTVDSPSPIPWWRAVAAGGVMFHLTCVGWLLFRAESIAQAWGMFRRILTDFRFSGLSAFCLANVAFYVAPLMAMEFWMNRSDDPLRLTEVHWPVRAGVYSYIAIMLLVFPPMVHNEFIYFQF